MAFLEELDLLGVGVFRVDRNGLFLVCHHHVLDFDCIVFLLVQLFFVDRSECVRPDFSFQRAMVDRVEGFIKLVLEVTVLEPFAGCAHQITFRHDLLLHISVHFLLRFSANKAWFFVTVGHAWRFALEP